MGEARLPFEDDDIHYDGQILAVVVAEPDPAKAALLQPTLRELERLGVPRVLFINKL